MIQQPLSIAVLILCLFAGCASPHHVVRELTLTANEVVKETENRNHSIKTLKGSGTITVDGSEASLSGSFEVNVKKPDSMRVEFYGPFGIHVGTLTLSHEQFLFYNRRENVAITGKANGITPQPLFRMNLRFDEVINVFTGEFPLKASQDSLLKFTTEKDSYVLTFRDDKDTTQYHIDGNNFVVTSYRVKDEQGKASLSASASEIDDADGIAVPTVLRILFPKEQRSVTIAYDEIRINEPVECSFNLPKTAELINR